MKVFDPVLMESGQWIVQTQIADEIRTHTFDNENDANKFVLKFEKNPYDLTKVIQLINNGIVQLRKTLE